MSRGDEIAAKIAAGIRKASAATGDGVLVGTILRAGVPDRTVYPPTPGADTEHEVEILMDDFSVLERAGSSTIGETDAKLMVSASGLNITPRAADRIRIKGTVYDVKGSKPIQPGGIPLYYEIRVTL